MHDSRQLGISTAAAIRGVRLCHYGYLESGRAGARVSLKPAAFGHAARAFCRRRGAIAGIKVDFTRTLYGQNARAMWRWRWRDARG
jgi:hypothetical protein